MPILRDITFYLDLLNGNDAARTAFSATHSTAASSTITTVAAHGLVEGAVIDMTGFSGSSPINGAWVVATIVSATSFTLADFTSNGVAGGTGTCTPRGGSSWADAWLTYTSGATQTRTATGNVLYSTTVRTAETPYVALSIGNVSISPTDPAINLPSGRGHGTDWYVVDQCDTAWTAVNSATSTTSTTRRQGSAAILVTRGSTATNTLFASKTIAGYNLLGYEGLSFYMRSSGTSSTDQWHLCLCSDTAGTTVVFTMILPAIPVANVFYKTTVVPDGLSAFSSAVIQSIALYSGSISAPSTALSLDNIIAYRPGGLHHQTPLVVHAGAFHPSLDKLYYQISGFGASTQLILDGASGSTAPPTFGGTSSPLVPLAGYTIGYLSAPMTQRLATSTTTFSGFVLPTRPEQLIVEGGYSTTTGLRTGTTYVASQSTTSHGYVFSSTASINHRIPAISGFSMAYVRRVYSDGSSTSVYAREARVSLDSLHAPLGGLVEYGTGTVIGVLHLTIKHIVASDGASTGALITQAGTSPLSPRGALQVVYTLGIGTWNNHQLIVIYPTQDAYVSFIEFQATGSATFIAAPFARTVYVNTGADATTATLTGGTAFAIGGDARVYANNITTTGTWWTMGNLHQTDCFLLAKRSGYYSADLGTFSAEWWFADGLILLRVPSTRPGGTGLMWGSYVMPFTSKRVTKEHAWRIPVATFACNAGSPVTVRMWMRATWTSGPPLFGFVVPGTSPCFASFPTGATTSSDLYAPIPTTVSGDWHLVELTFTPELAGIFSVFVYTCRPVNSGSATVRFDSCSMEQV